MDAQTLDTPEQWTLEAGAKSLALTVLLHPRLVRAGEIARIDLRPGGEAVGLSRTVPIFASPRGGRTEPLGDRRISRAPVRLSRANDGGVRIDCADTKTRVRVAGSAVAGTRVCEASTLRAGVVIELAGRVAVLLHEVPASRPDPSRVMRIIGESAAVDDVRAEIGRVGGLRVPVLITGETGTGKELVAAAIHATSPRCHRPMVSVNMASVPASMAATELFGHQKGSFTGATRDHAGYFERADGSTLFLDEVGDTPHKVQGMLLRALETGEVLPLGGRRPVRVDVRLIAATDADLDARVEAGEFRAPLFHRLGGYTIRVPALRERREDIGRLFAHFLAEELAELGEADRMTTAPGDDALPWIQSDLIRRLVEHPWPGNVRELRNLVRRLAIRNRGRAAMALLPGMLTGTARVTSPPGGGNGRRPSSRLPADVSDDELLDTLRAHRFQVAPTAAALGIPKSSLYYRIQKHPGLRKAADLPAPEIQDAAAAHADDVDSMAAALEVSPRGLQLRMREQGL